MPLRPDELFRAGAGAPACPLIDVRSPIEVSRGALPHARSLPLMTDEERHQVGVRYRDAGQAAALELGYELAGPHLAARTAAWRAACGDGPAAVACWRGGLRSSLAVEMIARDGVHTVEGGYKAIRAHLIGELAASLARTRTVVLTGLTGSGKTALLRELAGSHHGLHALDLEGEARHRGSVFGAAEEPQPSQATFENAVAAALLLDGASLLLVEDESRLVGDRSIPEPLLGVMRSAPVAVLELPLPARAERVFEEYVREPALRLGVEATRARLEAAAVRLRARLGGASTAAVVEGLRAAQASWFDPEAHGAWITILLEEHYDRLYLRARAARDRPVAVRGDAATVRDYLLCLAA